MSRGGPTAATAPGAAGNVNLVVAAKVGDAVVTTSPGHGHGIGDRAAGPVTASATAAGPVTAWLRDAYRELVARSGDRVL